jgi:hypothetical protein
MLQMPHHRQLDTFADRHAHPDPAADGYGYAHGHPNAVAQADGDPHNHAHAHTLSVPHIYRTVGHAHKVANAE